MTKKTLDIDSMCAEDLALYFYKLHLGIGGLIDEAQDQCHPFRAAWRRIFGKSRRQQLYDAAVRAGIRRIETKSDRLYNEITGKFEVKNDR